MLLREAVLNIAAGIVDSVLETPGVTIFAKEPGEFPRPDGFYADVDMPFERSQGTEERKLENDPSSPDLIETTTGYRLLNISIGFYRGAPMDAGRKVKQGFIRQSSLDILRAANLGLISRSDVRDVSEKLESGWEKRAQFDLTLSAIGTDSEIITSILGLLINGEFHTRGKVIPVNSNVEVTL